MKQYYVRLTNTGRVVAALVFTPLLIVPVIIFGAIYGPPMPEWLLFLFIFALLGVALALTIKVIKNISPNVVVTVNDDGFDVDFPDKGRFARAPFKIKTRQIDNYYVEAANGLYYMSFKTSTAPSSFNLESRSRKDEDLTSFAELMVAINALVENRNAQIQTTEDTRPITSVTMYEKPWAKILVVISIIVGVGVLGMALFMPHADNMPWWRFSALLFFGVPFAYKVYYHNYKKKSKREK